MSKNILISIGVFGIAILVIVAGFFLLGIEQVALNFWALGFLLFSLIISLLATIFISSKKKSSDATYSNAGIFGTVWVYQIVIIISILFTPAFKENLNGFILMEIIINALLFVIGILIVTASRYIKNMNDRTADKLNNGDYNKPKRGGF